MAQSVIGSLRVNLGLDSAQFSRGARRVDAPLNRMRKQFLGIAAVAATMGAAIGAAALAGAKQIDEAAKSARRLDASIGGFRALELAAGEAGVSLSGLTNDIQTMNRELSSIGTSGNGKRALDALGLSLSDLEGLDADAKLATIADQVLSLGLSAGETTAILRDLGVRNREMALLVLQGGDAIRSARTDIQDYGLAISDIDAARIEVANDALGRLGLITQYAGQQLAVALVPAMGAFAEAMTNSLREGGALRAVIDGLVGNLDRLGAIVGVAIVAFGTRYVAALIAARVATFSLAGSLSVLRTAIMRTGIGLIIIAAAELALRFSRLVTAAGGFGSAVGLLKDVAVEAFGRIGTAFSIVPKAVKAGALSMKASFLQATGDMLAKFLEMTQEVVWAMNSTFGLSMAPPSLEAANKIYDGMRDAADGAAAASADLNSTIADVQAPLASMDALREVLATANDEILAGTDASTDLSESLDDVAESAAGGGGAAPALVETKTAAEEAAEAFKGKLSTAIDSLSDAFADFAASGFKNFKGMVDSIKSAFMNMIRDMISAAIANPIKLALGIGGGVAGGMGGGGGLLSGIMGNMGGGGGIMGALTGGGGLAAGFSGLSGGAGIMGGLGNTLAGTFGTGGGIGGLFGSIGGGAGILSSIGAALPIIGIAGAVFSFFKKKTKLIDSGIRATIDMEDAMFESFKEIETSRFWGLSKKRRTSFSEMSGEQDDPLQAAVFGIRESVIGATESLGVSIDVFDGFTHDFTLSLKGLDEAARATAITEEFARMGDSLANLVPHIENMNQLFAVAANRVGLTDRLLQAQGMTEELTARIRGREMDATNELNKALLAQVFAAEDAAVAVAKLTASFSEDAFSTGVDFRRGQARASNGIAYSPQQSQAEMLAELKALNARIDRLQSTAEFTAFYAGQTAENTDEQVNIALETAT